MKEIIDESTHVDIAQLQAQFAEHMILTAPDLGTNNLAEEFAQSLFGVIKESGAQSTTEVCNAGKSEFYKVGKETLGPIAVSFVDTVLKESGGGYVVFPARDATPFFHIAQTLVAHNPGAYPDSMVLANPVFNRKMWGVDDEQDIENPVTTVSDPMVQKLLGQVGLYSSDPVSFVEVGAWGSMVDSMKGAMMDGVLPQKDFNVFFLFTHMPEFIYGYINKHAGTVGHTALEAIADSFEGLPKYFMRPTQLLEIDGQVGASLEGKIIDSPFLYEWSQSVTDGFIDAAEQFSGSKGNETVVAKVAALEQQSLLAQAGHFNGMLPKHTETWTEGEKWKANWQWGQVSPLGENSHA